MSKPAENAEYADLCNQAEALAGEIFKTIRQLLLLYVKHRRIRRKRDILRKRVIQSL